MDSSSTSASIFLVKGSSLRSMSRGSSVFSRSSTGREYDEEDGFKWEALERLPTYNRMRTALLTCASQGSGKAPVDVSKLQDDQRRVLVQRIFKVVEQDNERMLRKLRERIDLVGIQLPRIQVRFENLNVEASVHIGSRALPTITNFMVDVIENALQLVHLSLSKKKQLHILRDASGILKPSRMTLLLGPPGSGKTTLLLALAGRLDESLKVRGKITYNGHDTGEFVPQKTSAYISQHDLHTAEMMVRETLDFTGRCQGVGTRYEMFSELSRRESMMRIKPHPDLDAFLKATAVEGQETNIVKDYILKILALNLCADAYAKGKGILGRTEEEADNRRNASLNGPVTQTYTLSNWELLRACRIFKTTQFAITTCIPCTDNPPERGRAISTRVNNIPFSAASTLFRHGTCITVWKTPASLLVFSETLWVSEEDIGECLKVRRLHGAVYAAIVGSQATCEFILNKLTTLLEGNESGKVVVDMLVQLMLDEKEYLDFIVRQRVDFDEDFIPEVIILDFNRLYAELVTLEDRHLEIKTFPLEDQVDAMLCVGSGSSKCLQHIRGRIQEAQASGQPLDEVKVGIAGTAAAFDANSCGGSIYVHAATQLVSKTSWDELVEAYDEEAIPLFYITPADDKNLSWKEEFLDSGRGLLTPIEMDKAACWIQFKKKVEEGEADISEFETWYENTRPLKREPPPKVVNAESSDSESEESESEVEAAKPVKQASKPVVTKKQTAKQAESSSGDDESSQEEAKKPAAKKPPKDSSSDESSDEEEGPSKPPAKPAAKPVAKVKAVSESDDDSDESEEETKPSSKPATKQQPAKVPTKAAESSDDEEEEDTKPAVKQQAKPAVSQQIKKVENSDEDESEESESEEEKNLHAPKQAAKPAAKKESSDESDEESDESEDEKPAAKVTSAKRAADESEDESDEEDEEPASKPAAKKQKLEKPVAGSDSSDSEVEAAKPVKQASKPVVTKKQAAKQAESSSRDDESSEEAKKPAAKKPPPKKAQAPVKDSGNDESSDEEESVPSKPPAKPATKPVAKVKAASESDDDSDESEEETKPSSKQATKQQPAKVASKGAVRSAEEEEDTKPAVKEQDANDEGSSKPGAELDVQTPGLKEGGSSKTLLVRNLPYSATDDDIRKLFKSAGEVVAVRTAQGDNGPKGFAHVDFATEAAAQKAVEKSGQQLSGRQITCDFATPSQ